MDKLLYAIARNDTTAGVLGIAGVERENKWKVEIGSGKGKDGKGKKFDQNH